MKINTLKRLVVALTIVVATQGCSKETIETQNPVPQQQQSESAIPVELLTRFLHITLNVRTEEITLNADGTTFLIRGHKFDRIETENLYKNANVYHNTYGK